MSTQLHVKVVGDGRVGKTTLAYAIKRALESFDIATTVHDEPFTVSPTPYTLNRSLEAMRDQDIQVNIVVETATEPANA